MTAADQELPANVNEILRRPFPAEQIGALPRVTCKDCSDSQGRVCNRHSKGRCSTCGQWITNAHIHLAYVGHAAVTDRLLEADPEWNWRPAYRQVDSAALAAAAATGDKEIVQMVIDNAPPLLDENGGMWIRMTVAGVTRLGYGHDDDRGPDHNKKLIGDAIRNAAMRFGVAIDLWSKEDLGRGAPPIPPVTGASMEPGAHEPGALPPAPGRDWVGEAKAITDVDALLALGRECNAAGQFAGEVKAVMLKRREELLAVAGQT